MAGANNFKVFDENIQNMLDDASYAGSAYRQNGAVDGIAPTTLHNKLYYQISIMVAAIAASLSAKGLNMTDTDITSLTNNISKLQTEDEARRLAFFFAI